MSFTFHLALSQSGTCIWLRLFMWSVMADWWTSVVLRRVALVSTFLWSCVSTFPWCSLSSSAWAVCRIFCLIHQCTNLDSYYIQYCTHSHIHLLVWFCHWDGLKSCGESYKVWRLNKSCDLVTDLHFCHMLPSGDRRKSQTMDVANVLKYWDTYI